MDLCVNDREFDVYFDVYVIDIDSSLYSVHSSI